jgi:hypothetical protein
MADKFYLERFVKSVSVRQNGEWVKVAEFDPPVPYEQAQVRLDLAVNTTTPPYTEFRRPA